MPGDLYAPLLANLGIITIDVSSVPSGKKEGKKDKGRIKILTGREREGGRLRENKCVCVCL